MKLQPVPDEAALLFDRTIVVADLHIGIEFGFRESGFVIPSQTERMLERLIDIADRHKAERAVIVGDIKHKIKSVSPQERAEIPPFFERVLEVVPEVHLVPGNHDANIFGVLPEKVKVHDPKGVKLDDVGFTHGYAWPSQEAMYSEVLCMGHIHPSVLFVDRLGLRMTKRCWLRARFTGGGERYDANPQELIVIPSFNDFCGGFPVNSPTSGPMGPVLKSDLIDLENSRVYLLNGVDLGKLKDLIVSRSDDRRTKRPESRQ
ncbi:MAG: metallophosphoesterase [Thermoplasmata archaeon]|nr:metallophosphoesterase [Thermoplasmata archaeon]